MEEESRKGRRTFREGLQKPADAPFPSISLRALPGVTGEGRVLEPFGLTGLIGLVSCSSFTSSTGSLLGAGVMLWVDPPEDAAIVVLCWKLLIGSEVPLIFVFQLAFGSSDFFLKKPAMDVWFLELEFDLVSEGVGVPRVLVEDLEEGAMILLKLERGPLIS